MENDSFTPELSLYRDAKERQKASSYHITGHIVLNDKTLHAIDQSLTFKKGEESKTISFPSIKATGSGAYLLFATTSETLTTFIYPITPYGAPVGRRHTQKINEGTSEFSLSLPEHATPNYLSFRLRKSTEDLLYQLATETNDSVFASGMPCREPHPAGQLLAQVSVLKYLNQRGAQETKEYKNLQKLAHHTFNELIELQHNDGSWGLVDGSGSEPSRNNCHRIRGCYQVETTRVCQILLTGKNHGMA